MIKRSVICVFLIIYFLLISCIGLSSVKEGNFILDNNRFALKLYSTIKSNKENTFISPYSISTALAMTYAGAAGKTKEEMAAALEFRQKEKELFGNFAMLDANLTDICNKGDIELFTANAIWLDKNYKILPSYRESIKQYFSSAFHKVNYVDSTKKAARIINNWVAEKTQDKIRDLIHPQDINEFTRMVLTNAIYFMGNWKHQFAERTTRKMDFWLDEEVSTQVDMMFQSQEFPYAETEQFQILELPYKGQKLSMVVLLPKSGEDIELVEKFIEKDSLLDKERKTQTVDLYLPKFKIERRYADLKSVFKKMGMKKAFSAAKANFSGISPADDLFIGKIIHQAFIDVNEKGTEAAAATAVSMRLKAVAPPKNPVVFKADHPFFFIIQENSTSSILFLGRVNKPLMD